MKHDRAKYACTENSRDFTKKLVKIINKFRKAEAYKINMQKLVIHLYTNNELLEREIKKTIPFTIVSK